MLKMIYILTSVALLIIRGEATLTAKLLQKCINRCKNQGAQYCCGNRLNGEAPSSSNNRLSCANGCEIAYYSSELSKCKIACDDGNESTCTYKHPLIAKEFGKCNDCQDGCDSWPPEKACYLGCNKASLLEEFYKYKPCTDDKEWGYRGKQSLSCSEWVSKSKKGRCKKQEKKGIHKGKKVWEICPVTCKCEFKTCDKTCNNKNQCADNESFQHRGIPARTCKGWVKKRKTERCKLKFVSTNCPVTCRAVRKGASCENEGRMVDVCVAKKWKKFGCLTEERFGLIAGFTPASITDGSRLYGWSYYIRAFDLNRDTPVEELGYGQWTSGDITGGGQAQEVCGMHPHKLVCNENAPSDEDMKTKYKNCGSMDRNTMEKCEADCCGDKNKCGIGAGSNIEGGMGYWMYTLEHPHVKWMGLAGVTQKYALIGRTYLDTARQMCTSLGGAVRVSNNLVVGNDPMQFYSGEAGVDGFLGYMITRTPIGKRSDEDDANYWTIIVDAENFSGPVYYVSTWFWDALSSWSPKSKTMGDPEALITYASTGFEGNIGTMKLTASDGKEWVKTGRVAVPQDEINGVLSDTSTFYTGFSSFNSDWAADAMEPMLSGTGPSNSKKITFIEESAREARRKDMRCNYNGPNYDSWFKTYRGPLKLYAGTRDIDWKVVGGFGIGDDMNASFDADEYKVGTDAASCHLRFKLDSSKLQCTSGFCEAHKYLRLEDPNVTNPNKSYVPMKDDQVPRDIKNVLNSIEFEPTRINDGSNLGPPAKDEKACFEKPGPAPADSQLYCTRLASGTWLAFKWYRFVDQPELNQVFASLKSSDRDTAKCYMQARIERLHEAVASGSELPQWFSPPQGNANLPKAKVRFDPGYLVTPPEGLEKGFVPVVLWERNKEKPIGCDIILGDYQTEPDPFPEGYYDGYAYNGDDYRFREQCPANLESGGSFDFPGTVYPYPHKNYSAKRRGYDAPLKENVGDSLDADPVTCGLASDPPSSINSE